MSERYLPASDFLNCVAHGEVIFDETNFGRHNLNRLLAMVTDADRSNRDWATFLVSSLRMDTPKIREVLLQAAQDADGDTRDEAIVGLARRDGKAAKRLLKPLLAEDVSLVLLEAACILGCKELIPALEIAMTSGAITKKMQEPWNAAVAACTAGVGIDPEFNELSEPLWLVR